MIKRCFRVLVDFLRSDVWVLDGIEISSREPLKLIFAGHDVQKNYIKKLVYGSGCKERYAGKKSFWSLYFFINENSRHYHLAIIEGHWFHRIFYQESEDFFAPLWLTSTAVIPLVASNRSAKEDIRRLRKNKLSYSMTQSPDRLQDFYYHMYLPSVQQRHQDRTIAIDYDVMMKQIRDGSAELLLVKMEQEYIAGVVIVSGEKIPRLWSNGIREGKTQYWKSGAVAATYWFAAQHLSAVGHRTMHLGLSRGFLNDGVLQYKNKWQARFEAQGSRGFIIKARHFSVSVKGFLRNNPFVYLSNGLLYGAVFAENSWQFADSDIEALREKYDLGNLRKLHIFQFSHSGDKIEMIAGI